MGSKQGQKKAGAEVAVATKKKREGAGLTKSAAPVANGQPVHQLSSMEKIRKVRAGITRQDLEAVKESYGLDYETLAKVLSVAKATLFNKSGTQRFSAALSEKIFSLADLYSYGFSVFGAKEPFNRWMEGENRALGNIKPIELLDTMIGVEEVKNILGRIEHGVYS